MDSECIGVVGLGFLGRGIATCLLAHGFRVVGYTTGEHEYQRARDYIAKGIGELIDRASFPSSLRDEWPDRFLEAGGYSDFAQCGFVIESVFEDLGVKQSVFDQLEAVLQDSTPVGSNTSAIPISLLQKGRRFPARFLGMHWSEPAYATRFLELIKGDQTSDAVLQVADGLGRRTGKEPSMVQEDVPGFIANRLGYAMYREAIHLLESGVGDAETIDRAFRNACGLWATLCGPFRWIDITGGPALYARAMERVLPTLSTSGELPETLKTMLAENRRGVIDGKGFYAYEPGDASRWETLLHEHAWEVWRLQQRYHPLPPAGNQ
jgi:3-hydroxybutyryl-CoA dehydrogenase